MFELNTADVGAPPAASADCPPSVPSWGTARWPEPFPCVPFHFRHCAATTGEGETATTATRRCTRAEGDVAAETRLLKGGGRPHAFPSLGVVRAHGEEGPRVPTDLELGENRAPFVQETVMEHLLSASTQHRAGR